MCDPRVRGKRSICARDAKVQVRVALQGGVLRLSVEDDGQGFRLDDPRKPQSLGLVGLRERAHLLRGEVTIHSEQGQGTRVEARIPIPAGTMDT